MKLRYTRTVLRQIEEALSYIAARSPQGAAGMRGRIVATVALVQDHPHAAQATDRPDTRRVTLTPFPYVLFYRIAADEVVILRLPHSSRRPPPHVERS